MTPRQKELMQLFVSKGLHVWGAAAIVGNCSQEVGINLPSNFTVVTDHGSQGIAQWRLVRLTGPEGLEAFANDHKLSVVDLSTQGLFLLEELAKKYPALDAMMRDPGTRTLANLTANFMTVFERPSFNPAINKLDFRIAQAQICVRDFVPPVPVKHDLAVGGTGLVGATAIAGSAYSSGAGTALLVTALVAVALVAVLWYTHRAQSRSAASVAPANAIPITDSTQELRAALDELKLAYDKVAAAKAVLLTNRQQGDELLKLLEQTGKD